MKKLEKGFTLIELLVVIAIIGILATTLAPKLRAQLAKAKDAKAIALLGAVRTAGSIAFVDKMAVSDGNVELELGDIIDKLDPASKKLINSNGEIAVGGIRDNSDKLTYGGSVTLYDGTNELISSTAKIKISDDNLKLSLKSKNSDDKSTEGKKWNEY